MVQPELAHILERPGRLLFVGVGNVLKRDDGVGVAISNNIRERGSVGVLTVEVSIENYIGKIASCDPDRMVIIDCMDLGGNPGDSRLYELTQLEDVSFNTHNLSLGRIGEFFRFPVYVLGIQPESIAFGEQLTPAVRQSADALIHQINQHTIEP